MKRLTVIILPDVEEHITEQVLHIAYDSISNALAWESRLRAAINRIAEVPGYPIDEEASERLGYEVRKAVFEGTYLIHYRIDISAGVIRVNGFRHGARRPLRGQP